MEPPLLPTYDAPGCLTGWRQLDQPRDYCRLCTIIRKPSCIARLCLQRITMRKDEAYKLLGVSQGGTDAEVRAPPPTPSAHDRRASDLTSVTHSPSCLRLCLCVSVSNALASVSAALSGCLAFGRSVRPPECRYLSVCRSVGRPFTTVGCSKLQSTFVCARLRIRMRSSSATLAKT